MAGVARGICKKLFLDIMKTVFLFIFHRGYISDLLKGEYIKYLSVKYKVIVFLEESNESYYKSKNITYVKFPLKTGRFWFIFDGILRPFLIRRFDEQPGVQFRFALYSKNDWRKNILRRISLLLPKNFSSPKLFFGLEKIFAPQSSLFKKYLQKYQPSIVITPTPGLSFMEAWAILCAKKFNIPSVCVNFSWDNLTTYPRSIRKTDYMICWNEIIKKEAIDFHNYSENSVFASGIMRYDHFFKEDGDKMTREEFLKSKNLDPGKKTILVATATDPDPDLHKKIIRTIKDLDVNILVRVHPLERIKTYEEFMNDKNICVELAGTSKQEDSQRGWQIEMEEKDRLNVKRIFKYCDVNINRSSTISLDSLIFDMPVINLDFGNRKVPIVSFTHYRPLIEEGAARLAHNLDEVKKYALMYLENPSIDKENRKKIVDKIIGFTDGLSYKRNVDFLNEILDK